MKTTWKLNEMLKQIGQPEELKDYVKDLEKNSPYQTFADYYGSMIRKKGIDKAEVIRLSNIERTYGYQILNGTRQPGRDKILLLCLGAGFDLDETQRALEISKAGVLYARERRDAILIFAFGGHLSIADTQELLMQFEEKVLE